MEAVRCTQCGGTRWSLLPGSLTQLLEGPCELCGGAQVIERRRPGAGPACLDVERRRTEIADRLAGPAARDVERRRTKIADRIAARAYDSRLTAR